jgi:hypothetical protein
MPSFCDGAVMLTVESMLGVQQSSIEALEVLP